MAAGEKVVFNSDGKAVDVNLSYTVEKGRVAVVEGWLGFTNGRGESGDKISLSVDDREYQLDVGATVVEKGQNLFIDTADLTGHYPDSTAFSTTAGAGKLILGKVTRNKDANNIITLKMFGGAQVLT